MVAGEASGDRAAARVVARLAGTKPFGLGGPALAAAGCELVADLRRSTAMGIGEPSRGSFSVCWTLRAKVGEAVPIPDATPGAFGVKTFPKMSNVDADPSAQMTVGPAMLTWG